MKRDIQQIHFNPTKKITTRLPHNYKSQNEKRDMIAKHENTVKYQKIMKAITQINYNKPFEELDQQFNKVIQKHLGKGGIWLKPKTQLGQRLQKNGRFVIQWCRIIKINPYVNSHLIFKNVKEVLLPNTSQFKDELSDYLEYQLNQPLQQNDPAKQTLVILNDISINHAQLKFNSSNDHFKKSVNQESRLHRSSISDDQNQFQIQHLCRLTKIDITKKIQDTKIVGILENKFLDLFVILLIKTKQNPQEQKLAIMPLLNIQDCHENQINRLLEQYSPSTILIPPSTNFNVQKYWCSHLEDMFE